jgi:hypothetical protein
MKKATHGAGGLGDFAKQILGKPRSVSPAHPVLDIDAGQILNNAGHDSGTQARPSQEIGPKPSRIGSTRQVLAGVIALPAGTRRGLQ